MLRSKGRARAVSSVVLVLFLTVLACSPLEDLLGGGGGPSVEITRPASGTTVEVGQAVEIESTSMADAGIARVELLIDGEVVREDVPPDEMAKRAAAMGG